MKKSEVTLEHNDYYNIIMNRISEYITIKHTGTNRLISVDDLHYASDEMLCKECVVREMKKKVILQ